MIEFFNVRSGERRKVYTEPMLAAFYNSTNLHVNALQGQDFGWRLAPETVKRINEIKEDQVLLDRIAQAFSLPQGEVKDTDILQWISLEDEREAASKNKQVEGNYEEQYQRELAEINKAQGPASDLRVAETGEVKPRKPRHVNRDAGDGQFVSDEEASANPETTVTETVKPEESNKPDSNKQSDSAKIEASKPKKEN